MNVSPVIIIFSIIPFIFGMVALWLASTHKVAIPHQSLLVGSVVICTLLSAMTGLLLFLSTDINSQISKENRTLKENGYQINRGTIYTAPKLGLKYPENYTYELKPEV